VLGVSAGGLNDPEAFPSLGPGRSTAPTLHALRHGQNFRGAVNAPFHNLHHHGIQIKPKKAGKKGKGGGKNDATPAPVQWKSREEEQREAIRRNTMQAPVPAPAPAPTPARRGPAGQGWAAAASAPTPAASQSDLSPRSMSPAEATQRAVSIIDSVLNEENAFEFKTLCSLFNQQELSPEAFYRQASGLLPPQHVRDLFDLLVQSQPNPHLASALSAVHDRHCPREVPALHEDVQLVGRARNGRSKQQQDGSWARPRGPTGGPAKGAAAEDFPALPVSSGPKAVTSAVAQWDAFQKQGRITANVSLGVRKAANGGAGGAMSTAKKKNKAKDNMFFFGAK